MNTLRIGFAILCLFALTISAQATNYQDGYVNNDGYTYKGGYWYWGAAAYTLGTQYTPGYWNCGRYYPGSSYSVYTRAYPPAETPKANSIQEATKKLVTDKAAVLAMQDDVNTFVGTAKLLGHNLQAAPYIPPALIPYAGAYGLQGHYYQNFYAGGNTLYAPTPFLYGQLDLNQLNLNAAQLAQSNVDAGREATARHQQLVDSQNAGAAKVAELNAKHAFALELAKATYNNQQLQSQGFKFSISSDGTTFTPKLDGMPADKRTALQKSGEAVLAAKCAACHSDGKRPFQVSNWAKMSDQQIDALIADRLLTKDDAKLMPRKAEGGAGTPLGIDEVLALKAINAK